MGKVRGPLFGFRAQGSLGGAVTYQDSPGGTVVRRRPVPGGVRTLGQRYHGWDYGDCAYQWGQLSADERRAWAVSAVGIKASGYNLFMKYQMENMPGIVGRYRFDQALNSFTPGSSSRDPVCHAVGVTVVDGVVGGAFSFDGVDDYCRIDHTTYLPVAVGAVLFWVKNPDGPGKLIFSSRLWNEWATWEIRNHLGGDNFEKLLFRYGYGTGFDQELFSPRVFNDVLKRVYVGWNETTVKLYIDGLFVQQHGLAGTIVGNTKPIYVMSYQPWDVTKGFMDDLILLNRELNDDEIRRDYLREVKL